MNITFTLSYSHIAIAFAALAVFMFFRWAYCELLAGQDIFPHKFLAGLFFTLAVVIMILNSLRI